jgi:hypothetical protein
LLLVQVLAKNCRDASPARRDQHDRFEFLHSFRLSGMQSTFSLVSPSLCGAPSAIESLKGIQAMDSRFRGNDDIHGGGAQRRHSRHSGNPLLASQPGHCRHSGNPLPPPRPRHSRESGNPLPLWRPGHSRGGGNRVLPSGQPRASQAGLTFGHGGQGPPPGVSTLWTIPNKQPSSLGRGCHTPAPSSAGA